MRMKLNNEQAKHLADTLRIIAVAIFSLFGYNGVMHREWLQISLSTLIFCWLEAMALFVLSIGED